MERLAKIFGIAAAINFIAWGAGVLIFGGDAISGAVLNGHYYLGYKGHLTEVSHAVYTYAVWHGASVAVTFPIAFAISMGLQGLRKADAVRRRPVRDLRM